MQNNEKMYEKRVKLIVMGVGGLKEASVRGDKMKEEISTAKLQTMMADLLLGCLSNDSVRKYRH